MKKINPKIETSWKEKLSDEFTAPYFANLKEFLLEEKKNYTVYPPGDYIFNAFNKSPFHKIKIVILGQDPYHGEAQANGLCFSVNHGISLPPSLRNIYKEIQNDLGEEIQKNGDLSEWAKQGVLLLNATLTVRKKTAGSHQHKGWEEFTDAVIKVLNDEKENNIKRCKMGS